MADTLTPHLGLIKQDPDTLPDYTKDDNNLNTLDAEVWARGKKFNGESVSSDGEFHINKIPYAENLETSASQKSNEDYIIRTTGGDASIPQEGDAWLMLLKGRSRHEGYIAQSITMNVTPMARVAPAAITATLDEETFEAYVEEAGTYTISYTTEWDTSPTLYGLTITNTPVNGDSITMTWDGENDATVTVNAVTRPTPESISATINEATFVAYVSTSGTTTLTYSTDWSADPALYGITVTGTPIAGDVITVVYVKEVRGTIYQSNPQSFISTGWNLYNHSAGYARVVKYSTDYGFKIAGTYTSLEFSATLTGSRVTITPVSGAFTVPSDGYVFVSGGNNTDTVIWMTWSDWGSGYNWTGSAQGEFKVYEEHEVDISTFMSTNFPYGLMQVGAVQDEINLNIGVATSNVTRLAYNATNLANAKASGREYEYDENYIYIERETPVTYDFTGDGDYTAFDHGMEWFTGTDQAVYAETIYGANLKNKLERDVLTISQQTLTASQKAQVLDNLGINASTLREVPLTIATTDWSGSGSSWSAEFTSAYITTTSKDVVIFDSSVKTYKAYNIVANKKTGGGGLVVTTTKKPTGTITGTIYTIDANDGKVPILIENTVTPIANGGTGESTLAGAKNALGITALAEQIGNLQNIALTLTSTMSSKASVTSGGVYTCGRYYGLNLVIQANASISTGEVKWGTVSTPPKSYISGSVVKTSNTTQVGTFQLVSTGDLWINLTSSIGNTETITLCGSGFTN